VDRCEECGFDYASEDEASLPERLRTLGRRYTAPLSRFLPGEDGPALLRSHPVEGAWSALEYACHMRDVFEVLPARVEQALIEDVPHFEPMRREERVAELAYNEQDPAEVATAISANADAAADLFEGLAPEQWDRRAIANYPVRTERTVLWVGQHLVHEAHHHLLDVGRTMRVARGR
jgi:S-DNA-T family DNA segregation ATPase FtsK/SpoIIIE